MTKKMNKLDRLRSRIDLLDDKIVALLVKRYEYASEIGKTKKENGTPVKDSEREDRVIKRVRARTGKPLSESAIEKIYHVILKESRGMQSKKRTKKA